MSHLVQIALHTQCVQFNANASKTTIRGAEKIPEQDNVRDRLC